MSQADDHKYDDIVLAGEYSLHLLNSADRDAFDDRLANEPDLRAILRDWDEGFIALAADIDPSAPPRHLKNQISLLLFQDTKIPDAPPVRNPGRYLGGLFGALTAGVLAMLMLVALPESYLYPPGDAYTAQIQSEDRSLIVTARYDARQRSLHIDRLEGQSPEGRVLELWLIAEGSATPVSLGVLPASQEARLRLDSTIVAQLAQGTLAISEEPPGGSPTGLPTGAVLAVGAVTEL